MKIIKGSNPCEAWLNAVKLILEEGSPIEDEGIILKELLNLLIVVEDPRVEVPEIKSLVEQKYFQEVLDATLRSVPFANCGYSYGERIFNFKGVNQLDWVIRKLKKDPNAKSATIGILMPERDTKAKVPCMNLLDFKMRNGYLITTVVFRSHDYGRKALPNFCAVGKLMEKVAADVGVKVGKLTCLSISAHIYPEEAEKLKKFLGTKRGA